MKGDEGRVVAAFTDWLRRDGWDVNTKVGYVDVIAERDGERLYCEAKGLSDVVGIDIAYGQLLRRMPMEDDPSSRLTSQSPSEPHFV
jgi:predicted RecB family endonuclease